jgi:hypothetical protein
MSATDYIEQYKSYLQDLGNIGIRHENSRQFYLATVSALFTFLAMTGGKDAALLVMSHQVQIIVGGVGILLCLVWFVHMQSFGAIYRAKFNVLRDLESAKELFKLYDKEWEYLQKDCKYSFLTILDSVMPFMFIPLFVLLLIFK